MDDHNEANEETPDLPERARLAAELRALADQVDAGAPGALRKARRAVASTHDDPSARFIPFHEFDIDEDAIEFDEFGDPILRKRIKAPAEVRALWAMQWAWVAMHRADGEKVMHRALVRIGEILNLPDLERRAADLKAWVLQVKPRYTSDPVFARRMLAWVQIAHVTTRHRSSESFSLRVHQKWEAIRQAERRWADKQRDI